MSLAPHTPVFVVFTLFDIGLLGHRTAGTRLINRERAIRMTCPTDHVFGLIVKILFRFVCSARRGAWLGEANQKWKCRHLISLPRNYQSCPE